MWEKHRSAATAMLLNWGSNLKPRHVPWREIEPKHFGDQHWRSNQLSHLFKFETMCWSQARETPLALYHPCIRVAHPCNTNVVPPLKQVEGLIYLTFIFWFPTLPSSVKVLMSRKMTKRSFVKGKKMIVYIYHWQCTVLLSKLRSLQCLSYHSGSLMLKQHVFNYLCSKPKNFLKNSFSWLEK